jgi:hypothetical protein
VFVFPDSDKWIFTDDCKFFSRSVRVLQSEVATHHVTRHNTPIHNIVSTAPQLTISRKVLGTLPGDGNVMPKHVGTTIYN